MPGDSSPALERDTPNRGDADRDSDGRTRREDVPFLTGDADYTDDVTAPDMVHVALVRSGHGHARLGDIDTSAAAAMDGVLAVYTWDDIAESEAPGVVPVADAGLDCDVPPHPLLARDRVRYQGQPIAAVVAEDRYRARDGVEAVDVTYDPLPAVTDPSAATDVGATATDSNDPDATDSDVPLLFEGAPNNVALYSELGDRQATEQAFADADHTVALDLVNNRLIPNAPEPRTALAASDARTAQLTVQMSTQVPHRHRGKFAATLGLPERQIRVVAPNVGGAFGHKGHHHPGEAIAAWCAMQGARPVKWSARRSENYQAGTHGRDHRTHAELAVDSDGTVRGLRAETDAGIGGYAIGGAPYIPGRYGRLLSGQYDIPAIYCETRSVFTNTAPVHAYRGAGRPEAIYVLERLLATAARELDIDPAELRRRNQLPPDAFPYETPVGATYDSGDYESALDRALDAIDYAERREAENPRPDGQYVGVGLSCYVESTGGGFESGVVRVQPDGGVTVYAGTQSQGQGHETTYAHLVADELDIALNDIDVVEGDTGRIPVGTGTFGSRSAIVGGNAVRESAQTVLAQARRLAAHMLADDADATPDDIAYEDGTFRLADTDRTCSFADVAEAAYGRARPADAEPGLEATTFYEADGTAYTFGTHAAVVAVDPDTGTVDIGQYVAVDDCGERLNPTIIDGQVHGGVAQGIGQARYEQAVYDSEGDLRTDSLDRYAVPQATQLPAIETDATVTPSPRNELGVKGIGESGAIAAPPAVVNAVVDALEPLGIYDLDMPLSDETVWRAIHTTRDTE